MNRPKLPSNVRAIHERYENDLDRLRDDLLRSQIEVQEINHQLLD